LLGLEWLNHDLAIKFIQFSEVIIILLALPKLWIAWLVKEYNISDSFAKSTVLKE